jgi:hypothetical protein
VAVFHAAQRHARNDQQSVIESVFLQLRSWLQWLVVKHHN